MLIEFVGLAADVGYLEWQRLRAQAAADAAAAGAMFQLRQGANNAAITSAAQADAALNGFTNGVSNATVTVNHPPLNGSLAGNSSAVEVIVQQTVPTFFLSLAETKSGDVRGAGGGYPRRGSQCRLRVRPEPVGVAGLSD